jgi:hypothetical protein
MLYAQLHAAAVASQDRARLCACEPGDQLVARACEWKKAAGRVEDVFVLVVYTSDLVWGPEDPKIVS